MSLYRISPPSQPSFILFKLTAALLVAIASVGLSSCGSGGPKGPQIASAATIWVHPLPSASAWPGAAPVGGSTDFLQLFQSNSPWTRVAAHTQAFGLYSGWIYEATDAELGATVAFLNAHNMGVEIEAPALRAEATCGSGVEGYVPYGLSIQDFTLSYLRRLKALGAQVPFIKVDEPYFYGTVVGDPRSCHFSVQKVAAEVGEFVQLVKEVYPNVAVGDVEAIVRNAYAPDIDTALIQWHQVYAQVSGAPFPFFFADIDFTNPAWPQIVKALEDATRQQGSRFGIIYIGDQPDSSDVEWASKSVSRFHTYQGETGGHPDYVLFQSWQPHPTHCLPESNPNTLTGVVDAYLDATLGPASQGSR